jgi:hypothetical protein
MGKRVETNETDQRNERTKERTCPRTDERTGGSDRRRESKGPTKVVGVEKERG